MKKSNSVLLPGLDEQIKFLKSRLDLADKNILVLGSGSAAVSKNLAEKNNNVCIIAEDYDSMMNTKFELENTQNIEVKMMEFNSTDFSNDEFDLIYAQASISNSRRNKIIKEMRRIIRPEARMCIGEIVKLTPDIPRFVTDIFQQSDLNPLYKDDLVKYYHDKKFTVQANIDLSHTLKEYYEDNLKQLNALMLKMDKSEKSNYKKLLNRFSHESNAYLKLGGDKNIGFISLLLSINK